MKWITASDLTIWSKMVDARATLIDMVSDLIRAGAPDSGYFRFPGGNKAQVRGFDGDLECEGSLNFIPKGLSKWEFGVSPGQSKATSDYIKRTSQTSKELKEKNTLVLVNPNVWDNPTVKLPDWVSARNLEAEWLDVRYIDGSQLEAWLDLHPAVAAKYARAMKLVPIDGIISTDEFWTSYSSRFKPNIKENVLLCDREDQVESLLQKFCGPPAAFMYGAESGDDVISFAVAAIRSAPPETRFMLEAKTLIVESAEAARFLSTKKGLIFITRKAADAHAGELGTHGPTLSAATGVQARNHQKLVRPSASALGKALESMGWSNDESYRHAVNCGRSLTIFQRQFSSGPIENPEWYGRREELLPAVLAGGWSTNSKLDKEILHNLSQDSSYPRFESKIRNMTEFNDPPIDRVSDVWQIRSPVDAFPYFTSLIGEEELEKLRNAATQVFSRQEETPKAEDKFQINFQPNEDYSSWLRDGLAFTLLQLATVAEAGGLHIKGQTPQQFVNSIVSGLPEWAHSHRTIINLRSQLSTIAEAAPEPFLLALERMLEGKTPEILKIFQESEEFFVPSSPHTSVLFSLEMLAWDPRLLVRVAEILARLASIDPGGKLINRPINSLRSIFLPWSPNTYASCSERLACIGYIVDKYDNIGWDLLVKLLPRSQDSTSPNQKPILRDITPRNLETLTFGLVWEANSYIVKKAVSQAGLDEEKLILLVNYATSLAVLDRHIIVEQIEVFLKANQSSEGTLLWRELQKQVFHHEAYITAEWALPTEELENLTNLLEQYAPSNLVAQEKWLFDDWNPRSREINKSNLESIEAARSASLNKIHEELGIEGILKLLSKANLPHLVIYAFPDSKLTIENYIQIFLKLYDGKENNIKNVSILSGVSSRKYTSAWKDFLIEYLRSDDNNSQTKANLFLNWINCRFTWETAFTAGSDIESEYWKNVDSLCRSGTNEDLFYSVRKFQEAGRSFDILELAFDKITIFPGQLIIQILMDSIPYINDGRPKDNGMVRYYIQKAFEVLRADNDISLEEVARCEYAYLFFLDDNENEPNLLLHQFMAESPDFYFEIISNVYRRDDEDAKDLDVSSLNKARLSYHLLYSFNKLPGFNNDIVNGLILTNWIEKVRLLANNYARIEITDQSIGRLLAHSPIDPNDQFWPHSSIRNLLEKLQSDSIEKGVAMERFNMRGVYSKSIYEGGVQERELSQLYIKWADGIQGSHRIKRLLKKISEDWEIQAKVQDDRAEKIKLRH